MSSGGGLCATDVNDLECVVIGDASKKGIVARMICNVIDDGTVVGICADG